MLARWNLEHDQRLANWSRDMASSEKTMLSPCSHHLTAEDEPQDATLLFRKKTRLKIPGCGSHMSDV